MVEVTKPAIGSEWKDNDPRVERIVRVVAIDGDRVKIENVKTPGRYTTTANKNFGRTGKRGFSEVKKNG